ncbi:MAG TPA: winged helix-turn-helix transcriptional regulator [Solirubrobacteraceae bacterium]|nr:winged helix-turn-helix transcriptional regulator [Solirubrobacteraceae bacterium]
MGDKWTLLIIRDLMSGPRRFVELQRVLPGISTEQLRSRLNRMVADGMLTRQRYREVPPRVDYELTERARELAPILGELARWGYNWAWSQPRESEHIDIGAIFRLLPGLVADGSTGLGSVTMTVTDGHAGESITYRATFSSAGAAISENDAGPADAALEGTTQAWVDALAPSGDRSGLEQSGKAKLATDLLDAVALAGDAPVEVAPAAESA